MDVWSDRVCQFSVEIVLILYLDCRLPFLSREILHYIVVPVLVAILVLSETESRVAGMDRASNED